MQTPVTRGYSEVLRRLRRRDVAWWAFVGPLALLVLFPLIALQLRAFGDGLGAFQRMVEMPRFQSMVVNTVGLAVGSVLVAVPLGVALAYFVTRSPRRIQAPLSILPLVPLMIPQVALVMGWIFLLAPRVGYINSFLRSLPFFEGMSTGPINIYSISGIVILTGYNLASFVYLFVYTSMRDQGYELIAAAGVSGASPMRAFWDISLPLLRPAIVYSTGIILLLGLGQFTAPFFLGAPRGINVITTDLLVIKERFPIDYELGAALGTPLLILGLVVIAWQKRAIGEQRRYEVVTGKSRAVPLPGRRIMVLPVVAYAVVSIVVPLLAVAHVAGSPYWSGRLTPSDEYQLVENIQVALANPRVTSALINTAVASLTALVIVVPIGFLAALAMSSLSTVRGWTSGVIDFLVTMPLGMPAAIFGFAILYSFAGPPLLLYGSLSVIVIAYVVLMIPHAMRPQLSSLIAIGREYTEAAKVSGAGSTRIIGSILVPLIRRGIAGAGVLVIILLTHEFAASMMVRSARVQVLGTLLADIWQNGLYPQVAIIALIMTGFTAIGVALAMALGSFGSTTGRRERG